jgi:hypothetical protein
VLNRKKNESSLMECQRAKHEQGLIFLRRVLETTDVEKIFTHIPELINLAVRSAFDGVNETVTRDTDFRAAKLVIQFISIASRLPLEETGIGTQIIESLLDQEESLSVLLSFVEMCYYDDDEENQKNLENLPNVWSMVQNVFDTVKTCLDMDAEKTRHRLVFGSVDTPKIIRKMKEAAKSPAARSWQVQVWWYCEEKCNCIMKEIQEEVKITEWELL